MQIQICQKIKCLIFTAASFKMDTAIQDDGILAESKSDKIAQALEKAKKTAEEISNKLKMKEKACYVPWQSFVLDSLIQPQTKRVSAIHCIH